MSRAAAGTGRSRPRSRQRRTAVRGWALLSQCAPPPRVSGLNTVGSYRSLIRHPTVSTAGLSGVGDFKPCGNGRVGAPVRAVEM